MSFYVCKKHNTLDIPRLCRTAFCIIFCLTEFSLAASSAATFKQITGYQEDRGGDKAENQGRKKE